MFGLGKRFFLLCLFVCFVRILLVPLSFPISPWLKAGWAGQREKCVPGFLVGFKQAGPAKEKALAFERDAGWPFSRRVSFVHAGWGAHVLGNVFTFDVCLLASFGFCLQQSEKL
jgi:hypothetical protein